MARVSVSLLVYNEGEGLKQNVESGYKQLQNTGLDFDMWVFDNHSEDNTVDIMNDLLDKYPNLYHYRQPQNIGYALSTLSSMKIPQTDIIVTVDGDAQYNLEDVKLLVDKVESKEYDIVFAVRHDRKDPFLRCLISGVFNKLSKFILSSRVRDLNCGFRVMSKETSEKIEVYNPITFVGPEIFVRASLLKLKIGDQNVRHFPRMAGQSVFEGFPVMMRNSWKMFKYLLQLKMEMKEKLFPQKLHNFPIDGGTLRTSSVSSSQEKKTLKEVKSESYVNSDNSGLLAEEKFI